MVDRVHPDLVDRMIDALGAKDKTRAILIYYRTNDSDLETAWKVVQQLQRDLGEVEDLAVKPSHDASVKEVKAYLAADRSTRWKRFIGTMVLALICCGWPGYVLVGKSKRLKTSLQSLFWSSAQATITKVGTYSTRTYQQQRTEERHYQDFTYRYKVDNEEYSGFRGRLQYYSSLGGKPLKRGDQIRIYYNPAKPDQSLYKRKIYQLTVTLLFNLAIMAFGIMVAFYAWFRERRWRQLHHFDQHLIEKPIVTAD